MSAKHIVKIMDETEHLDVPHSRGAKIQILLGSVDQMPNFYTRRFTIEPGGRIPAHRHDTIEHEQVVLVGEMIIGLDGEEITVRAGQCIYIPAGCAHWYENRADTDVKFLCMIPGVADYGTEWLESPANSCD